MFAVAGPDIGNKWELVLFLSLERSNTIIHTGPEFMVFSHVLASQVLELQIFATIAGDRMGLSPEINRDGEVLTNLSCRKLFLTSTHELSLVPFVHTGFSQIRSEPWPFFPSSLSCV